MRHALRLSLIAAASLCALAASQPAQAQFFGWFGARSFDDAPQAPPPRVIRDRLERQGYQVLGRLKLNGDVVIADAYDPSGRRLRLIVDPATGDVLQRYATAPAPRLADRSEGYAPPGYTPPPASRGILHGFLDDGSPAPPRVEPPAASAPRVERPKAKPKAVARVSPHAPTAMPAPTPEKSPAPPRAAVKAAPAENDPKGAPAAATAQAAAPVPAPAASAPAPTAPPAPAKAPSAPGPAKPGYANGVPINPLD